MYDEQSQEWKQTIPPMPTASNSAGVLSQHSALVVAGGLIPSEDYTNIVEIFKPDTLQWYKTDLLPTDSCAMSLVTIGNTCYALGGYKSPSYLNQVFSASVDDLLCNLYQPTRHLYLTVVAVTFSHDESSAWKILPNTPTCNPASAVLAGNLLAVGGKETSSFGEADKMEV